MKNLVNASTINNNQHQIHRLLFITHMAMTSRAIVLVMSGSNGEYIFCCMILWIKLLFLLGDYLKNILKITIQQLLYYLFGRHKLKSLKLTIYGLLFATECSGLSDVNWRTALHVYRFDINIMPACSSILLYFTHNIHGSWSQLSTLVKLINILFRVIGEK